jgi:hypothetical protein
METETPQPEDLDDEQHDAFGGAPPPPADHDVDWTPPSDRPAHRSARKWIAAGVAAVVVATGAFFGVRSAASNNSTAAATAPAGGAQGGGFGGRLGGPGGGPGIQGDRTIGLLQSDDGSTLTLQRRDGQTVKVTTTASTQVTKVVNGTAQPSSVSALTVGEPVIVTGTTGSDGTVAATAIRQGGGPGAGGGPGFAPPGAQQQNATTA